MKKTMRFLSLAALALVGAIMTGCSNEDDFTVEPENKSNVVTLTTTVGIGGGAETRALTAGGVKTFEAGETMAVIYNNGTSTVKAVSAELTASDITNEGKTATFTFELTDPNKTQNVTYIYPAAMAGETGVDYSNLNSQNGSLATLASNLDLATYYGAWDGASLPSATLDNQLAVCALTLKDNATPTPNTITSGLTKVTVSDGSNTYTVTPTSSTFGEDVIYVAIRPVTAALQYTATDGTKNYTKTATSREYAAGNFYNLGLRMYKMAAAATSADKGKLICADGHIHAYGADAACTKDRVAIITYVGSDNGEAAPYNHGLAIALGDEGSKNWSTAKSTCEGKTAITGAKWCLPSRDQWKQMFKANGGNDASYTGLNTTITNAGGTTLQENANYWSSSVYSTGNYFCLECQGSGVANWRTVYEVNNKQVRACLAF